METPRLSREELDRRRAWVIENEEVFSVEEYLELDAYARAADDGFKKIEKELSESMVGHGMPTPLHDKLTAILAKCRAHRLAAGRGK